MEVTPDQLITLAPHARDEYRVAFAGSKKVFNDFAINTPRRVAHFMAQVLHESEALTILAESLNYSHAERLQEVWPLRFPTRESARQYTGNPEKLANFVYGGRMGNREPGDGWKFIGRGLLQITGRVSYDLYGKILGIPLTEKPELAYSAQWSLQIACAEWKGSGCNEHADLDDIIHVTKAINGGLVGFGERKQWLAKTKKIWYD